MTKNDNELCTGNLAGEFHASQNVVINEIAGDASTEDVADTLIEDQLRRRPGINTTQNDRKRPLPVTCFRNLLHKVTLCFHVFAEASIALL